MIGHLLLVFASLGSPCYVPPVAAPVAVPFRAPACTYCPGHRGVQFDVAAGTLVLAAAPGVVQFAGIVAGVRYVVVSQPDGLRATYGMLAQVLVGVGESVAAGDPIGRSGPHLYFGLRDGVLAIDPTPLLGRWIGRPRLVPLDGRASRPATDLHLACPSGSAAR